MKKIQPKIPGAYYHVTARANLKEDILKTDEVKLMFEEVLKRVKKRYSLRYAQYCIMDNHVHIEIKPTKGSDISDIMRWIFSVFTKMFNKRFNRKGHLWVDRAHRKVIQTKSYFRQVFYYIARNPVKARMVESMYDYRFGGLYKLLKKDYRIMDPPDEDLLEICPILRHLAVPM
jgi:putative transposase